MEVVTRGGWPGVANYRLVNKVARKRIQHSIQHFCQVNAVSSFFLNIMAEES